MDLLRKLKEEKGIMDEQVMKLIKEEQKMTKLAGEDKLACTDCRGVPQYLINGSYVSKKDLSKVKAIAQKDYDRRLIEELRKQLVYLEKLIAFFEAGGVDRFFNKLCKNRRKIVTPIVEPREQFIERWIAEEYEPYGRWEDVNTEIYTIKGERVRSKTEKSIADELLAYNVPYKYEAPLELIAGGKSKIFRPDFKALNRRTCKEFIIEHLGMMGNMNYYNRNLNKLDVFEKNGYLLGVNLLIFHETAEDQVSISVIRKYIEEYLV